MYIVDSLPESNENVDSGITTSKNSSLSFAGREDVIDRVLADLRVQAPYLFGVKGAAWNAEDLLFDTIENRRVPARSEWHVNAATVFGELDPLLLERPLELGYSKAGSTTMKGRWTTLQDMTVARLIDMLSKHREGEKDGECFLQGPALGGMRHAQSIPHLDILVLDLDTGESIDAMRKKLIDLGLFGIIYTTHSHMKPVTHIKRDALVRWIGGGDAVPALDDAVRYLAEVKRYRPEVLIGAELVGTAHIEGGIHMVVKHQPMAKFRVVLVLKERFVIADRANTQAAAITEWKERYAGASKLLGAFFDRSCVDPSRLFFSPRHPKGSTEHRVEVIAGKPLDIDTVDRVTAEDIRREALNPFELAAEDMSAGAGTVYQTENIKQFFAKYGNRFDIETFFLEVDPEGDRGPRSSGLGRTHRCPNDDHHTNAGDENDAGFFCVNADDSDVTGSAVASCRHDSCATLDRINFVDLACQAAGITDAMDSATGLGRWVPLMAGEESAAARAPVGEAAAAEAGTRAGALLAASKPAVTEDIEESTVFSTTAEAKRAVMTLAKQDNPGPIARRIGMSAFTATEQDQLRKLLNTQTGVGLRAIGDEMKVGRASRPTADRARRDGKTPVWLPDGFHVEGHQIVRLAGGDDGTLPICDLFRDPALKRDNEGGKWGLRIVFNDLDGNEHEAVIPRDRLVNDAPGLLADLVKEGFGVVVDKRSKDALITLLGELSRRPNLPRVLEVNRPGWQRDGKLFVTPTGEVIGADESEEVILSLDAKAEGAVRKGSMDGSKSVFAACFDMADKWHWALLACCAFGGPLVQLLGDLEESGGIAVVGLSGFGKSTGQFVQASAWTNPTASKGCLVEADGTLNSLEEPFLIATGTTLAINEAKHLPAKAFAQLPFKIAGGKERGRMTRAGRGNREKIGWALFVTVNCERHAREFLASEGIVMDAGHVARLPEVSVSGTKLPGDHPTLVRLRGSAEHFGHLGPAFVRGLIAEGWNTPEGRKKLQSEITALSIEIAEGDPNLTRPARKFAIARWAGEAARRYGLLPADADVAGRVAAGWQTFAEGEDAMALQGVERAIRKLRDTILTKWDTLIVQPGLESNAYGREIIGYYNTEKDGQAAIYILVDKLSSAGGGTDTAEGIAKELSARGMLIKSGKNLKHDYIPGKGKIAHYRLPLAGFAPDVVAREVCDIDDDGERSERIGQEPCRFISAANALKAR